ncbi:hypothetical protein [endosymbiont GvMRE of Glomus versiforme]|uniref:hypothetical protein n=1 Tax=endosymbiont GvMRE of Glomus versiforme TaxID=2039283 RepID=UPI000EC2CE29|nr:hypothetical protein [endosymbiont GvMRE of Glomus versiforme]RHZ37253.1 hypothetical protein GvMRE_I1g92 [endosymbiont GvMRE of Glomus versiforme]RHZ37353.1 hypothetical protein GvMRE_I1g120 [endosymbiont GvMRE of Glomus versiforme]
MTKTELILKQTCLDCFSTFQLLEIHEEGNQPCSKCLQIWQKKLHQYYQEKIILHLAHQESQKEETHD